MRTYVLVLTFESKYGEVMEQDIKALEQKLIDYGNTIKQDNNKSSKHVGLHFNLTKVEAQSIPSSSL